jgi:hypothetical protein
MPSTRIDTMTNALMIVRPFTAEDTDALNASAVRFCERHSILDTYSRRHIATWQALDSELWVASRSDAARLRRMWQACFCRALGMPVAADVAVAYGYVGRRAP